ncbi:YceD family protein [Falsirhodobacter algicola]|uniref:DUF177 domain-containing protein n=1 Tax=Falsirhodobacter algicola TaxID=2692330 RepID=A0A8J8MST0_9RHOB|nr:DUF177 domain-containing protein [Falsirhodobacter algicola]QUS35598.1 DUF177 domain-containing protein [Falsirhodobacter algicola]
MTDQPLSQTYRVASLPTRKPQRFTLTPTKAQRAALAADLGITQVHEMSFAGEIRAEGRSDFVLTGKLTAVVEQPCVVSLEPVITPIAADARRRYSANYVEPEADEVETPDDDALEPLPAEIDIAIVAVEELALNLPAYPRRDGAQLGEAVFTAPGEAPLKDNDLRPFAGLQALKDKLNGGN